MKLGYVQEATAITSDLARMSFPNRLRMQRVVTALGKEVRKSGKSIPDGLRDPLCNLERVVLEPIGVPVGKEVKDAIVELREACGPRMLDCLISWPAIG